MAAIATPEEIDRMRQLRGDGWSYNAIAREVGRSKSNVRYWTNDERRTRERERARLRSNTPEAAQRRNERRKERYHTDPDYRRKRLEQRALRRKHPLTPQQRAKRAAYERQRLARMREAYRIQREQMAIKQAVKKAGAAEAELYAMAEKMQDVMGQAHREATDREKRAHYAKAGEFYRQMRDEIVRGLGVG